jgi:hypothetical protein
MISPSQRALVRFSRYLSIDVILTVSVTAGCTVVLTAAYMEGQDPLNGSCKCLDIHNSSKSVHKRTSSPPFRLSSEQCSELQSAGYLVVDNFLTAAQVEDARDSIEWDRFQANPSHADDETIIRTDLVYFQSYNVDEKSDVDVATAENDSTKKDNGMQRTQGLLRSVGYAIATSNFSGFRPSSAPRGGIDDRELVAYNRDRLFVPTQMQVSLYQPGGNFYRAHTDACTDTILDLGLMGYLRSWYLQKRYVTCIVYLNDTHRAWEESDGGCLRIFHGDSEGTNAHRHCPHYTDIKPASGRMVLFSSEAIQHAVLPTFAPRLACCVWFTLH